MLEIVSSVTGVKPDVEALELTNIPARRPLVVVLVILKLALAHVPEIVPIDPTKVAVVLVLAGIAPAAKTAAV